MKESHYNMYMRNVGTLDTTMGHHCAAASVTIKNNLKVDLGKCVQMYRAPFLCLPGALNSVIEWEFPKSFQTLFSFLAVFCLAAISLF